MLCVMAPACLSGHALLVMPVLLHTSAAAVTEGVASLKSSSSTTRTWSACRRCVLVLCTGQRCGLPGCRAQHCQPPCMSWHELASWRTGCCYCRSPQVEVGVFTNELQVRAGQGLVHTALCHRHTHSCSCAVLCPDVLACPVQRCNARPDALPHWPLMCCMPMLPGACSPGSSSEGCMAGTWPGSQVSSMLVLGTQCALCSACGAPTAAAWTQCRTDVT